MPQNTTVPDACALQAKISVSCSFLGHRLKQIIPSLVFEVDFRVKDAQSVLAKVPDGISLLSVCTLAMKEWGPGTVSAQSHSNQDVLLWGLSLLLPSGSKASHTHTYTEPQRDRHRPTVAACSILDESLRADFLLLLLYH